MPKNYKERIIITYIRKYFSAAISLIAVILFIPAFVSAGSTNGKNMAVCEISSVQAFDLWKQNRNRVKIIDCRTKDEFASGHPEMAVNIPIEFMVDGSVVHNPDFEFDVEKVADRSDTVLMICRTGRRSLIAAMRMLQAGYPDVKNITDGFEGKTKKRLDYGTAGSGWKNSALPWKK